jgi:hypothetical protein
MVLLRALNWMPESKVYAFCFVTMGNLLGEDIRKTIASGITVGLYICRVRMWRLEEVAPHLRMQRGQFAERERACYATVQTER